MRKFKINSKRLERIISHKECRSALDRNLELYDSLTPSQRQEIKEMLIRNKSLTN